MIAFGPVPSRRLGRSVGINNIPPKTCTYSCVYCQLGHTMRMEAEPGDFYNPADIQNQVAEKIDLSIRAGESIDYLTFVADGEPTLDARLGQVIDLIRSAGIKVAVITNSSLVWRGDVREHLQKADWVSLKVDSVHEGTWRKINRAHRSFELRKILDGVVEFAKHFKGTLSVETMLVRGLNDGDDHIKEVSDFIRTLSIDTSYLSVPTRPPAEKWVQPPTEETLVRAYQVFTSRIKKVETLIGYEGNAFALTGDAGKDILSITAVHPMREEAVGEFLEKAGAGWSAVDRLVDRGVLVKKVFQGNYFYARKLLPPLHKDNSFLRLE